MTILKKDLQSLQREIKAIEKKMEKLITTVEKGEKPEVAKKTTAKPVKAKTTKRAPAKKAPVKKKPAQLTATDQVLGIINRSKNGVNTDIVKKLKKRSFFWTIYKGESPTSILSHFLVGVCAPREVNFRQSSS